MIRKRAVKDTVNPPGQVRYVPTLDKSIEQWKQYEQQRNTMGCMNPNCVVCQYEFLKEKDATGTKRT